MKKRYTLLLILIILGSFISIYALKSNDVSLTYADKWLITEIQYLNKPLLNNGPNIAGRYFRATDFFEIISLPNELRPAKNRKIYSNANSAVWKEESTSKSGFIKIDDVRNNNESDYSYNILASYIDNNKYQNITFKASSYSPYEVYLNGNKILSYYEFNNENANSREKSIRLEKGKHDIIVKTLCENNDDSKWEFKLEYISKNPTSLKWSTDPTKNMDLSTVINGTRLTMAAVSPSGKYVKYRYNETKTPNGKSQNWTDIIDLENNKIVMSSRHSNINDLYFHPCQDAVYFRNDDDAKAKVFCHDLKTGVTSLLMEATKDMNSYTLSYNGDFIIYGKNIKNEKSKDGFKRHDGVEDRAPWWRNQTHLYMYDVKHGTHRQLTAGKYSSNLHDISNDGKRILISQNIRDYKTPHYSKQVMMEINLQNNSIDTLWNSHHNGSAQYSPDATQLLVTAPAAMFNNTQNTTNEDIATNDYNIEAYIFDIKNKNASCISKDFTPNIKQFFWCEDDNKIYLKVEEKSYNNVYVYNLNNKVYKKLDTQLDNVISMSKSKKSSLIAYYGNGIHTADKAYVLDLKDGSVINESNPEKDTFNDISFGKSYDYTYTTKDGISIDGYYYLPPDFDSRQKYPMIVCYYGGAAPMSRSFRDYFPRNYFASNGYIVYVIIPSGSTGYGQEYADRLVNDWGNIAVDEIIESTKQFIKDHDFVDEKNIGCMGASYGGFLTEILITRTDIFKAAISHAGISSISSYWGEGFWAWSYNSTAAANSYPWNNKELYVEQSALFNADKINTPLLLLHGSDDTNVPIGESMQLYTALKLLGKECELIEIENENHYIKNYSKHIKWQKTIMAWWDKHLKNDSSWWEELY